MIGRMVVSRFQADKINEVIDLGQKAVTVLAELHPTGYRGYLSLADRGTGRWITIQLWDTEADAMAWVSNPKARELLAPVVPYIIDSPIAELLEVVIRD